MNRKPDWLYAIHRVELARHDLRLRRRIPSATGGNLPVQPRLFCRITRTDGVVGFGEAAPHPIYGPSLDAIESLVRTACDSRDASPALPDLVAMALLDANARGLQIPAWQQIGIAAPPAAYRTVITFGGDDPDAVCRDIALAQPPAIKLKLLGGPRDLDVVRAISGAFPLPLAVDVNGAWPVEDAARQLAALEMLRPDLLWVEQPCPPAQLHHRLPTALPIFADEAVDHTGIDLSIYDGVVLKPARVGITRCVQLAQRLHDSGQDVTFGCHLQSSLMSAATLSLCGLATSAWVDLDTVLLIDGDPFEPPTADPHSGRICTPQGAGFGCSPRVALSWQPVFQRA